MKINGQLATADFQGVKKEVNISLVDVKIGEFVMVHAGFAIEKISTEDMEIINKHLPFA